MVWLKLDADLHQNEVWSREPDRTLWVWMLMAAKKNNPQGQVRFSITAAKNATAHLRGHRQTTYSDKELRSALRRLESQGRCKGPTWADRRADARSDGYYVVSICNWETYQIENGLKVRRKGSAGALQGHSKGSPSREREGELESSSPSEKVDFADEIALWNAIAKEKGLPTVRTLNSGEQSSLKAMISETTGNGHLERAFRAAAEQYASMDGRKYNLRSIIRAANRGKWLDIGREPNRAKPRLTGKRYDFDVKKEKYGG